MSLGDYNVLTHIFVNFDIYVFAYLILTLTDTDFLQRQGR